MYPFELTVKKASGEKILRVGANYRTKKSVPYGKAVVANPA